MGGAERSGHTADDSLDRSSINVAHLRAANRSRGGEGMDVGLVVAAAEHPRQAALDMAKTKRHQRTFCNKLQQLHTCDGGYFFRDIGRFIEYDLGGLPGGAHIDAHRQRLQLGRLDRLCDDAVVRRCELDY